MTKSLKKHPGYNTKFFHKSCMTLDDKIELLLLSCNSDNIPQIFGFSFVYVLVVSLNDLPSNPKISRFTLTGGWKGVSGTKSRRTTETRVLIPDSTFHTRISFASEILRTGHTSSSVTRSETTTKNPSTDLP